MDGINSRELEELYRDLDYISESKNFEKESKKFLNSEGNKLKRLTLRKAKVKVKEKTGNYIKGIKRGKNYRYKGALSIRVYNNSPHAHLVEYGHRLVTVDGKEYGYVDGKNVFKDSAKVFSVKHVSECKNFVDKILKKNNL